MGFDRPEPLYVPSANKRNYKKSKKLKLGENDKTAIFEKFVEFFTPVCGLGKAGLCGDCEVERA